MVINAFGTYIFSSLHLSMITWPFYLGGLSHIFGQPSTEENIPQGKTNLQREPHTHQVEWLEQN